MLVVKSRVKVRVKVRYIQLKIRFPGFRAIASQQLLSSDLQSFDTIHTVLYIQSLNTRTTYMYFHTYEPTMTTNAPCDTTTAMQVDEQEPCDTTTAMQIDELDFRNMPLRVMMDKVAGLKGNI